MKKYSTLLLLTFGLVLQAQNQDNFIGEWTANDSSVISIYIQDSSYYAKADGEFVLIQMVKKSETHLYGGTYYDTELNTEYEAKLKMTDRNTIRLKIIKGLSSEIIVWHRVPNKWNEPDISSKSITTK
jgi:uncharacterized protein (DUF2147 family)